MRQPACFGICSVALLALTNLAFAGLPKPIHDDGTEPTPIVRDFHLPMESSSTLAIGLATPTPTPSVSESDTLRLLLEQLPRHLYLGRAIVWSNWL